MIANHILADFDSQNAMQTWLIRALLFKKIQNTPFDNCFYSQQNSKSTFMMFTCGQTLNTIGYIVDKIIMIICLVFYLRCAVQKYTWGRFGENSEVALLAQLGDSLFHLEKEIPYAEAC